MSERERLVHALIVVNRADFHSRPQVLRNVSKSCREECVTLYEHCLKDENPKVRIQAAEILVAIKGVDAIKDIAFLQNDPVWRTRRKIKKIIRDLGANDAM